MVHETSTARCWIRTFPLGFPTRGNAPKCRLT